MGAFGGCGCDLTACHCEIEIIDHDDRNVEVAAGGVDEVVSSDRSKVAVAGKNDHRKLGADQLDAGCPGEGAAMHTVEGIRF